MEQGVHDRRVLLAMAALPRDAFLARSTSEPDEDLSVAIERGHTVPSARLIALMLQALELRGDERVLDVGTGSGYQAALLGHLAREVYSIEIDPALARSARSAVERLGCSNVHVEEGDGSTGWPSAGPYDAIIVGAAATDIPRQMIDQLAEGGRLVIPLGSEQGQLVERLRKHTDRLESETLTWCALEPLAYAWGRSRYRFPWVARA